MRTHKSVGEMQQDRSSPSTASIQCVPGYEGSRGVLGYQPRKVHIFSRRTHVCESCWMGWESSTWAATKQIRGNQLHNKLSGESLINHQTPSLNRANSEI